MRVVAGDSFLELFEGLLVVVFLHGLGGEYNRICVYNLYDIED